MSYDDVDVLAQFADRHRITLPLLSDAGSRLIRKLGLENVHVEAQNRHFGVETRGRHAGLPYPGSFRLDQEGVVVAKCFEQAHLIRPSATVLMADALEELTPVVRADAGAYGVSVEASLHTGSYHPRQIYEVRLQLRVPDGQKVYVPPTAAGLVPLEVKLAGPDSLAVDCFPMPAGEREAIPGTDAGVWSVAGLVDLRIPFRIDEDEGDVELNLSVTFQTCTDRECWPPVGLSVSLPLEAGGLRRPG